MTLFNCKYKCSLYQITFIILEVAYVYKKNTDTSSNLLWYIQLPLLWKKQVLDSYGRDYSVPFSLLIRTCDGSNRVFNEPLRFGKVNKKPLTDNPSVLEYLFEKFQLISLSYKTVVFKLADTQM